MSKSKYMALLVCLIFLITNLYIPVCAGSSGSFSKADAFAGMSRLASPAGFIDTIGQARISGRTVTGRVQFWAGETIESPASSPLRIELEQAGIITLRPASAIRASTSHIENASSKQPNAIIYLLKGEASVQLRDVICGNVFAGDSEYTTSAGAAFRIRTAEGKPFVESFIGEVKLVSQQTSRGKYILRPAGLGATTSVLSRATRQIQIQVTDENDKPVPDLPLVFSLFTGGAKPVGSISSGSLTGTNIVVQTNSLGLASATFTAGSTGGTNMIMVTIQGTRIFWTTEITVVKVGGFWTTRKILLLSAIAGGVGVLTWAIASKEDKKDTIAAQTLGIRPNQ